MCVCVYVCVISHISDILRSVEHNTSPTGHPSLCTSPREERECSKYNYVGQMAADLLL